MKEGALHAVSVVPDAVLEDTNRLRSSLLRREGCAGGASVEGGGCGNSCRAARCDELMLGDETSVRKEQLENLSAST